MSANIPAEIEPIIDAIPGRKMPMTVLGPALAAVGLGIAGFGYGMVTDPVWTWGAFLVALVYTLAMAQGGVLFAVMLTLTEGRWGRPLKRIGETFGFFLPLGYIGLLIFLVGGNGIYSWHAGAAVPVVDIAPHSSFAWASKPIWLDLPFFIGRQAAGFALLIVLDAMYIRASLRTDIIKARARLGDKAPGWWSMIAGKSTDLGKASASGEKQQRLFGVFIAVTYAMVFSFAAFDLIMSLAPWWFANMFGAWFFVSSFWLALATLGITGLLARDWLKITPFVTSNVTHDLGKLTLAACMFWAYTSFAQLLPIWYSNMPEETDFLLVRLTTPEWSWLSKTVAVMCFLLPFTVLLSRGIKKMKWPFIGILLVIMTGIFLERTLLVMPSIYFGESFPVANFLFISVAMWLGGIGLFATVVTWALANVPPIVIGDQFLETHPWDVHVHSLDHGHGH